MPHLEVYGIMAAFTAFGVISAYFLVTGLREGRFAMRVTFGLREMPVRDGRDPCFIYRDNKPVGFWLEAGMQIVAIAACFAAIGILIMVS